MNIHPRVIVCHLSPSLCPLPLEKITDKIEQKDDALDDRQLTMPRKCCYDGCYKSPSFNYEGEKIPAYCVGHSKHGMVDVFSKFCAEENCRVHPSFNYPYLGTKIGKYCSAHKCDGMVDVRSRRCQHEDCCTFPTFNYPGNRPGLYCSKHKLPNMGDVRQHFVTCCRHEDCEEAPCYNFPDKKGLIFCALHKSEGMVYKVKTCDAEGCSRKPTFNFDEYSTPILCADHRLPGMTYVSKRTQTCEQEGCKIFPSFNYEGVKGKRFCAAHRLPGMVEGKRRICEAEGCQLHPSFNYPGETRRRFCASHRVTGMVSVGRKATRSKRNRSRKAIPVADDGIETPSLTMENAAEYSPKPVLDLCTTEPADNETKSLHLGTANDDIGGRKRRVSQMEMRIGVEELMRRPSVPTAVLAHAVLHPPLPNTVVAELLPAATLAIDHQQNSSAVCTLPISGPTPVTQTLLASEAVFASTAAVPEDEMEMSTPSPFVFSQAKGVVISEARESGEPTEWNVDAGDAVAV